MSEVVRSYTGKGTSIYSGSRRRRRRGLRPLIFLAGAACVFLFYAFWISRDNHPIEQFMPDTQQYRLLVSNALKKTDRMAESKRGRMAGSAVWGAIPENDWMARVHDFLSAELDRPHWVIQNVMGGDLFLSGDDFEHFDDLLLVTRMTPVGCLIERFRRFLPGIEYDEAGGLGLRRLPDLGVYYAVRGRVFVASASRRAVIRALTLSNEEQVAVALVEDLRSEEGLEDLRGTVVLSGRVPDWEMLESMRFALRIGAADAELEFQGVFRPEWKDRLERLTAHAAQRTLAKPHTGPLEISANLGLTLNELAGALTESFDLPWLSRDTLVHWDDGGPGAAVAGELFDLLGPLGPGVRATWRGMDLDAMIPVPLVVAAVDGQRELFEDLVNHLPEPPEGPGLEDWRAYYDRDTGWFHAPLLGDPAWAPTAGWRDGRLLVSSSEDLAQHFFSGAPAPEYFDAPANLYFSVKPAECLESAIELSGLLVENGLLRDHSPESVHVLVEEWREKIAGVSAITGLLDFDPERLSGRLRVVCP